MSISLPDKWVRKAVFDALAGMNVSGNEIPTYDSHTTTESPDFYVLMTTQTNNEEGFTKCGSRWASSILLDVITRYQGSGNTGSRLLADEIAEEARSRTENLTLDVLSGLTIKIQNTNFPNDITTNTGTESIFRKFIRLELTID